MTRSLREIGQNGGGDKNVYERDLEKEQPTQPHQLIVAKARQSPADPHEDEKERSDLREEDKDIYQPPTPSVRPVWYARKVPAAQEKRYDNGGASDHRDVFAQEKKAELHRAILSVIAAHQFGLRLGKIERQPVCFGEERDGEDDERNQHRDRQQPFLWIDPVSDEGRDHPAVFDLIADNLR